MMDDPREETDQPKNHRSITAHIAAIGTSIGVSKVKASPSVIMVEMPTHSEDNNTLLDTMVSVSIKASIFPIRIVAEPL
jgi:hypothetical protein